jgi:hypothetical protein
MTRTFTGLDLAVLLAYLVGTTALGVWLGRGQKDARDYFVAGKAIPWWAILFSVVATETSALTFISIPGLAYLTDFAFLQIAAGYLLGRIVIAYTLLPRYYEGELVTAYALLERRFGVATRRVGVDHVHGDARLRRLGARVRHGHPDRPDHRAVVPPRTSRRCRSSSSARSRSSTPTRRHARGHLDRRAADGDLRRRRRVGALPDRPRRRRRLAGGVLGRRRGGQAPPDRPYVGVDRANTLWAGLIGGAFLSMARTAPTSSSSSGSSPRPTCTTRGGR